MFLDKSFYKAIDGLKEGKTYVNSHTGKDLVYFMNKGQLRCFDLNYKCSVAVKEINGNMSGAIWEQYLEKLTLNINGLDKSVSFETYHNLMERA